MSLSKLITNYTSFNLWANTQIVDWLKGIDIIKLYQETSSSYTSIDYTLQHILRTQKFWQLFNLEKDVSTMNWSVREGEVENIMSEIILISEEMKSNFEKLSEVDLCKTLHLNMPWAENKRSRYEYIMHVINHSTYHRGQIITMARSIGITEGIPNTDYNFFNCIE
jgi:uncharacterized damage-inducible protein DinB